MPHTLLIGFTLCVWCVFLLQGMNFLGRMILEYASREDLAYNLMRFMFIHVRAPVPRCTIAPIHHHPYHTTHAILPLPYHSC